MRIRAFLDSNVLVSGIHTPDGPPGVILRSYSEGRFQIVVSRLVLDQVIRGVSRKMPAKMPSLVEFLLQHHPEICPDPRPEEVSRFAQVINNEDAPILAAAINAQVDYLVTGDKHFLSKVDVLKETGVAVVSPSEFVELL